MRRKKPKKEELTPYEIATLLMTGLQILVTILLSKRK